jgi:hypothetical protein
VFSTGIDPVIDGLVVERNAYIICEVDLRKQAVRLYWKRSDGTPYATSCWLLPQNVQWSGFLLSPLLTLFISEPRQDTSHHSRNRGTDAPGAALVISRVNHPRRDLARNIGVCPASPPTP